MANSKFSEQVPNSCWVPCISDPVEPNLAQAIFAFEQIFTNISQ